MNPLLNKIFCSYIDTQSDNLGNLKFSPVLPIKPIALTNERRFTSHYTRLFLPSSIRFLTAQMLYLGRVSII